jgi:hypothetical protein
LSALLPRCPHPLLLLLLLLLLLPAVWVSKSGVGPSELLPRCPLPLLLLLLLLLPAVAERQYLYFCTGKASNLSTCAPRCCAACD